MDINFAPPPELVELAEKTKAFVVDKVIPYEKDPRWTAHGPTGSDFLTNKGRILQWETPI